MRIVDLSVTLDNDQQWAPPKLENRVERRPHSFGNRIGIPWCLAAMTEPRWWPRLLKFFAWRRRRPKDIGWADDVITLNTHGTTHLDAPWHYAPTSEGRPAKTIDEIPLSWCYGDGVVLDMRHKRDGEEITVADVQQALGKISYTLKSWDIVLVWTGNDRLLGSPDYFCRGSGVGAEATRWLIAQGVKVMGIDAWGWDLPLPAMAERARQSGTWTRFWEAHRVGVDAEYCHMERLANLQELPPCGFKICCFPLKVKGGSAGPCRVVAIIED